MLLCHPQFVLFLTIRLDQCLISTWILSPPLFAFTPNHKSKETRDNMNIQEYFLWFDEVVHPTEPMFRSVPRDKLDWKLTSNSFSLGQLLNHIPRALWFNARVINKENLPVNSIREIVLSNRRHPSSTVGEAVGYLHSSVDDFKWAVERLGEERFAKEILNTPQRGKIPAWRFCAFTLEHHIHHVMELHLCLKFLGVDVDTRTLYVGEKKP